MIRFLHIVFAIVYLCLQLGEQTRSAAQDWLDIVENKLSHNVQLFSQNQLELVEFKLAEKDEPHDGSSPIAPPSAQYIVPTQSYVLPSFVADASWVASVLLSAASPRAPPQFA